MTRNEIDWLSGQVEFWDLDRVDLTRATAAQEDDLKEDLAQIAYPGGVTLDVGWYRGAFGVLVVANGNWDRPLFRAYVGLSDLADAISRAVRVADSTARNSRHR